MKKFQELQQIYKSGGNVFVAWVSLTQDDRDEVKNYLMSENYANILARIKNEPYLDVCLYLEKLENLVSSSISRNDEATLNFAADKFRRLTEMIDVHYCLVTDQT